VIIREVANNPFLSPIATPPLPWTGIRTGAVPSDYWGPTELRLSLVSRNNPSIQGAVRRAISDGRMDAMLSAVHSLQSAAFKINEPVLDCVRRSPVPLNAVTGLPCRSAMLDLATARAMAAGRRFYVSGRIDFRGRYNAIPYFNFARNLVGGPGHPSKFSPGGVTGTPFSGCLTRSKHGHRRRGEGC